MIIELTDKDNSKHIIDLDLLLALEQRQAYYDKHNHYSLCFVLSLDRYYPSITYFVQLTTKDQSDYLYNKIKAIKFPNVINIDGNSDNDILAMLKGVEIVK